MNHHDNTPVSGRIALGLEYNGGSYKGWQRQASADSVQERLEKALNSVLQCEHEVVCAGRTDAGVHASGQVVHFDTEVARSLKAYTRGVNTLLPDNIAVTWAKQMLPDFHARYSATARTYRYVIYNSQCKPGLFASGLTRVYQPLDETKMHQAAQAILGEHDFSSFRASLCQSKTPFRKVLKIAVERQGDYVIVEVQANAFVHHMVRNIVGSLIEIGAGNQSVEWMQQLLALKDRTQAAATAKPNGLYLVKVDYPDVYELPMRPAGPLFLNLDGE